MLSCFQAGAQATGARLEYRWADVQYAPLRPNSPLAEACGATWRSSAAKVDEVSTSRGLGSTDMGNVSAVVPAIHPTIAVAPRGVAIHTPEFAHFAASEEGHRGLLDAAKALAMTAVDVLVDDDLRRRMQEEFGKPVQSETRTGKQRETPAHELTTPSPSSPTTTISTWETSRRTCHSTTTWRGGQRCPSWSWGSAPAAWPSPWRKSGHSVVGIDSSRRCWRSARRKADRRLRGNLQLVLAEMTEFSFDVSFGLIFCALGGFLHLDSQEEQVETLERAPRHLAPDGLLALDLPNPEAVEWEPGCQGLILEWTRERQDGTMVSKFVSTEADRARQVQRVHSHLRGMA